MFTNILHDGSTNSETSTVINTSTFSNLLDAVHEASSFTLSQLLDSSVPSTSSTTAGISVPSPSTPTTFSTPTQSLDGGGGRGSDGHQPQNSDDTIPYENLSHEELKRLHLSFLCRPTSSSSPSPSTQASPMRMQAPARKPSFSTNNINPDTTQTNNNTTPSNMNNTSQPATPIMIQQQPQVVVLQTQPFIDGDYPLDFSPIPVQYAAINTNPVFISGTLLFLIFFTPPCHPRLPNFKKEIRDSQTSQKTKQNTFVPSPNPC